MKEKLKKIFIGGFVDCVARVPLEFARVVLALGRADGGRTDGLASDVILIVTKTIYNIGDFALGNWHFLSIVSL